MDTPVVLFLTVHLFSHTWLTTCHQHEPGSKWLGSKGIAGNECVLYEEALSAAVTMTKQLKFTPCFLLYRCVFAVFFLCLLNFVYFNRQLKPLLVFTAKKKVLWLTKQGHKMCCLPFAESRYIFYKEKSYLIFMAQVNTNVKPQKV